MCRTLPAPRGHQKAGDVLPAVPAAVTAFCLPVEQQGEKDGLHPGAFLGSWGWRRRASRQGPAHRCWQGRTHISAPRRHSSACFLLALAHSCPSGCPRVTRQPPPCPSPSPHSLALGYFPVNFLSPLPMSHPIPGGFAPRTTDARFWTGTTQSPTVGRGHLPQDSAFPLARRGAPHTNTRKGWKSNKLCALSHFSKTSQYHPAF